MFVGIYHFIICKVCVLAQAFNVLHDELLNLGIEKIWYVAKRPSFFSAFKLFFIQTNDCRMCVSYSANVKEDHEKWGEKSTKEGIHQTRYQKEYMLNMMESMRWGPKKDKKKSAPRKTFFGRQNIKIGHTNSRTNELYAPHAYCKVQWRSRLVDDDALPKMWSHPEWNLT